MVTLIEENANHSVIDSEIYTPVNADRLLSILRGYDNDTVDYLFNGFKQGFIIPYQGALPSLSTKNLKSAYELPNEILEKINSEVKLNRIAGPFKSQPFYNFVTSPIGLVPKKTPGKFRFIHHLSHPKGTSVNDGILEEFSSVSYSTVDDAIAIMKSLGPGAFMAKTDIESAFRLLPIHPDFRFLLGFRLGSNFYYDRTLPMGLAASCQMFETFSSAIEWAAIDKLGIPFIIHLLDDFFIAAPDYDDCKTFLGKFLEMCKYVGIPMAKDKTTEPSTIMSFAGIELDSMRQEARLPEEKVEKCFKLLDQYHRCKKVSLKDLQSIIGYLNFCCYIIPVGRAFLRRLIDLCIGIEKAHYKIRLNTEARADLATWKTFLASFNGKGFFHENGWEGPKSTSVFTDSSGSHGFGGLHGNKWFYGPWPPEFADINIAILEMYPIVISFMLWQDDLSNRKVTIFSDNHALVYIINKCSSKDPTIMDLVRKLIVVSLQNNIVFRAQHIPGKQNKAADALSRLNLQVFKEVAPQSEAHSSTIPNAWRPENFIKL